MQEFKILVIDDNNNFIESLKFEWKRRGIDVQGNTNFLNEDAGKKFDYLLTQINSSSYNLLIIDFNIISNKQTGYDLIKELKKNENHTPMILISGDDTLLQENKILLKILRDFARCDSKVSFIMKNEGEGQDELLEESFSILKLPIPKLKSESFNYLIKQQEHIYDKIDKKSIEILSGFIYPNKIIESIKVTYSFLVEKGFEINSISTNSDEWFEEKIIVLFYFLNLKSGDEKKIDIESLNIEFEELDINYNKIGDYSIIHELIGDDNNDF